jgi:NADH dehydrogenase [ubiquinone] 1 alpha subcomplex assembly factor 6
MPSPVQKSYFAIRAFNVELASVKDSNLQRTGEGSSLALLLRIQWWRDALEEIYTADNNNNNNSHSSDAAQNRDRNRLSISCWHSPVVRALHRAIQVDGGLTRRFLERLIDARHADLDVHQHANLQESVEYAEDSVSSLLYLSLELNGVREDAADEVASLAGKGIGLVTVLRATPYCWQRHGYVPVPSSLLQLDGKMVRLPPYDELLHVWDTTNMPGADDEQDNRASHFSPEHRHVWDEAIRHIAHVAAEHLTRAQVLQSEVPRAGRAALLPVVPAMHYLSRLQDHNSNVFDPHLRNDPRRLGLLMLMGRAWLTGIF